MLSACPSCRHALTPSDPPPSFCPFCGSPLRPRAGESTVDHTPEPLTLPPDRAVSGPAGPPPASVGGYRLIRPLGQGGMGTVYEAEEPATGRRVAVKLIRPEYAATPDAVERFRREGRLASTIAHPHCVFVHAADEEAGRPYLVLELMPGRTLADLVRERGPLPPDEAVRYLLDVLDGLSAAHRVGVVHRDIKPSNCFLGADGRVKVGDFGLSKSLLGDGRLTRTGSFLGTPLYASPEQVRGDAVDARSDLYSAAATLYFLLTGRAPFEGDDPVATLARIVSEAAPPLRALRPAVPRRLEQVVLRGLERDRRRRYRDLDEFRRALLPFVPANLTPAPPGRRFVAYLVDWLLFVPTFFVLDSSFFHLVFDADLPQRAFEAAIDLLWPLYFFLLEERWEASPGKRLFRLRVRAAGAVPASWRQVLLRTAVFAGTGLPAELYSLTFGVWNPDERGTPFAVSLGYLALHLAAAVALLGPMRRSNGYRGLHELLSGTCVVALPGADGRTRFPESGGDVPAASVPGKTGRIGPFAVCGDVGGGSGPCVLRGEDSSLGRNVVVIVRHPGHTQVKSPAEVTRPTRLRWLAGGREGGSHWDAYLAPVGRPITDLAARGQRLTWVQTRQLLDQLSAELEAARGDGSLPAALSAEQVWLQPDGQVVLAEVPLGEVPAAGPTPDPGEDVRCRTLLAEVTTLALEGARRTAGDVRPVRAPVPPHARPLLARLVGAAAPFTDPAQFRAALAAVRERPAEVSRVSRRLQLTVQAALLAPGVLWVLMLWPAMTYLLAWATLVVGIRAELTAPGVEAALPQDAAALAANGGSWNFLSVAWVSSEDLWASEQLPRDLDRLRRERDACLLSGSGFVRLIAQRVEADVGRLEPDEKQTFLRAVSGDRQPPDPSRRPTPEDLHDFRRMTQGMTWEVGEREFRGYVATAVLAAGWPLAWVVWAALTRGGLVLRLSGLALVAADGRPAQRWRVALRALLVWAPFVVLSVGAFWLELWRLGRWSAGAPEGEQAASAWAAWLAWWLALGLLPLYLWLAQRLPTRAWHDRLAGTWLVPR